MGKLYGKRGKEGLAAAEVRDLIWPAVTLFCKIFVANWLRRHIIRSPSFNFQFEG